MKDHIDPYSDRQTQLESRRAVLEACEQTMERLAKDPLYFAQPERALFQDIRRYFPITAQAQVAWAVKEGVSAAVAFIEEQIEAGEGQMIAHQQKKMAVDALRAFTKRFPIDATEEQIEQGAFDGGVARCRATTRKGKPCQRTPLPERDYCPSHQHLERSKVAA